MPLLRSCCNYTGFNICRRPDMIQSNPHERGAQCVNESRDKNTMVGSKREREVEQEEMEGRNETRKGVIR